MKNTLFKRQIFYYAFHIWEGVKIIHFFPIAEDIFSMEPDNGAQRQSSNWIDGLVTVPLRSQSVSETRHFYKCLCIDRFPNRAAVCADLSGMNPVCKQTVSSWKLNKSQYCYLSKSSTFLVSTPLLVERSCKTLYLHKLFPVNFNSSVHLTNIPRNIYKDWGLSIKLVLIVSITLTTEIFTIYTLLDTDWTNGIGTAIEIYLSSWVLVSHWCPINSMFPWAGQRLWEGT